MIALGLGLTARSARQSWLLAENAVRDIFASYAPGYNGVWYDPSDLSTMFQDSAGTTPVTAVEQPVGLILDKSGRGNHASQATTGYKPVLSARVNLLTKTDAIGASPWTSNFSGTGIAPVMTLNYAQAPNGDSTATRVVMDKGAGATTSDRSMLSCMAAVISGASYLGSLHVKATSAGEIGKKILFRHVAGSVYTVVTLSAEWQKVSVSEIAGGTSVPFILELRGTHGASDAADFLVWGADLRLANIPGCPEYQRVNTATDYDTVGFPRYLKFDGSDDFLVTGNVDFSASDKIAVAAGVRKLSDLGTGMCLEFSASVTTNNGSFYLAVPRGTGLPDYQFAVKGTTVATRNLSPVVAPDTRIVSCLAGIGGAYMDAYSNGVLGAGGAANLGAGNFGNYPLYIGRRGGTSLPFNGHLYGLCVIGGLDDITKLREIERLLAKKTGVTI